MNERLRSAVWTTVVEEDVGVRVAPPLVIRPLILIIVLVLVVTEVPVVASVPVELWAFLVVVLFLVVVVVSIRPLIQRALVERLLEAVLVTDGFSAVISQAVRVVGVAAVLVGGRVVLMLYGVVHIAGIVAVLRHPSCGEAAQLWGFGLNIIWGEAQILNDLHLIVVCIPREFKNTSWDHRQGLSDRSTALLISFS